MEQMTLPVGAKKICNSDPLLGLTENPELQNKYFLQMTRKSL